MVLEVSIVLAVKRMSEMTDRGRDRYIKTLYFAGGGMSCTMPFIPDRLGEMLTSACWYALMLISKTH